MAALTPDHDIDPERSHDDEVEVPLPVAARGCVVRATTA
jgi:hypothetical protein